MIKIKVCHGRTCSGHFSNFVFDRAKADLGIEDESSSAKASEDRGWKSPDGKFELKKCPCQGKCEKAITVVVEKDGKTEYHQHMNPIEMGKLIKKLKN